MISFIPTQDEAPRGLRLLYRRAEYSFDVDPRPEDAAASLSLNEVELEIDARGRVLCVTGYCPYLTWLETSLSPPPFASGGLAAIIPEGVQAGASIDLDADIVRWPVYLNREGWVCVGNPAERGDEAVGFAPGSVAVLSRRYLVALWLHPLTV